MATAGQVDKLSHQVIDPELDITIVDLGLVYSMAVEDGQVRIATTMPHRPPTAYLLSTRTNFP